MGSGDYGGKREGSASDAEGAAAPATQGKPELHAPPFEKGGPGGIWREAVPASTQAGSGLARSGAMRRPKSSKS